MEPQPPSPERPDAVNPADGFSLTPGANAPGSPAGAPGSPADADAAPPPPPPLTPLAWFKQNGWFYIALAALHPTGSPREVAAGIIYLVLALQHIRIAARLRSPDDPGPGRSIP